MGNENEKELKEIVIQLKNVNCNLERLNLILNNGVRMSKVGGY